MPIAKSLKRANYRWWYDKSCEGNLFDVDEQIKALGYIEHLSASTSTDISKWDIVRRFSENGVEIETDKNKLNGIFFELMEKDKDASQAEETALAEEQAASVAEEAAAMADAVEVIVVEKRKRILQRDIRRHDEHIVEYANSLQQQRAQRFEATVALDSISATGTLLKNIESLSANGFWVLEKCLSPNVGIMYACTRGPVVMQYRGDTINFGILRVKMDFVESRLQVLPCRQNVFRERYFHPHLSDSGEVCWGNAEGTVSLALARGDFATALELLQALLCTYNHESPYVSFEQFKEDGHEIQNYRRLNICQQERRLASEGRGFDFYARPVAPAPEPEPALDDEGDAQGQYDDEDD